ncbi:hypothetical protein [Prevotella aurantiaca]|jgi:hypothetical protein|uniref:Uncharacterized protein n=1 Tax=Prevotella aurantiaca TaxID=596085 RepID=A0A930HKF1_9BACT|nr:hypothetical protein [Prevotella aurantiaca]MBF1383341.1 hypothetical protein [Prevotella aurantiaca]
MMKTVKTVQTLLSSHREEYVAPMCEQIKIDVEGMLLRYSLDGGAGIAEDDDDDNWNEDDEDQNRA